MVSIKSFQEDYKWHLPCQAWDGHVHVFQPAEYPYAPSHAYSPMPAPYSALLNFERSLAANLEPQNIVLVQPSPYGTDNSLIMDILAKHSPEKTKREMRAIVVINPEKISDDELDKMQQLGVRGIRLNAEATGEQVDFAKISAMILVSAKRVSKYKNWNCQLFLSGSNWKCMSYSAVPQ
jgi:predicted TIM-barrel fold metal-dependent hydrolase